MTKSSELLQRTFDLLIPKVVSLGPMHGWAIAQRIHLLSAEVLTLNQGALYPALHRLEHQAWIAPSCGESDNKQRAKYHTFAKAGRQRPKAEEQCWDRLSVGVQDVLKAIG
jgi:PadR family transcriptional regulator, regulatory protein PadR